MRQQLNEFAAARDQTEHLLRSIIDIGSDLDLNATLHHIVTTAMALTGARYGALANEEPNDASRSRRESQLSGESRRLRLPRSLIK